MDTEDIAPCFLQTKDQFGLFRAIGVGFFLSAAVLFQKTQSNYFHSLTSVLLADSSSSHFQFLFKEIEHVTSQETNYGNILRKLASEDLQLQLGTAFAQLYSQSLPVSKADPEIQAFLRDPENSKCLRGLALQLCFALDVIHARAGLCPVRVSSPAVYIHITVNSDSVGVLAPTSAVVAERVDFFLYENFEREYREVVEVLAKALLRVQQAGPECVLPHSRLMRYIKEAIKYDMSLDLSRLILASRMDFTSKCTPGSHTSRTQLHTCRHTYCHDCLLVKLYNANQHNRKPMEVAEVKLSECCLLTAEQVKTTLTPEELEAVKLQLVFSPPS